MSRRAILGAGAAAGLALLVIGLSLLLHAGKSGPLQRKWRGAPWENISEQNLSASCRQELNSVRQRLANLPTTSLMAVIDGKVLLTYGAVDTPSIVYSVRKSLLSMLYGSYVAKGVIDLNSTLAELDIDDVGGLLPIERRARLHDLLASRSGVYHLAANPGDDAEYSPQRGSKEPGAYFLYNNWDFNAAGTAFEKLTHRDIYQAFADDLAEPLQLEDFDVASQRKSGDASRSEHLAYHFRLSTRDMSRLGLLMLERGRWKGRQLIPSQWIDAMTAPVTAAADMHPAHTARRGLNYGLLWWVLDEPAGSPLAGAYMAWGYYGQYILVIPQRRMVISHKRDLRAHEGHDPVKVKPEDFLHIARMLADAPCTDSRPPRSAPTAFPENARHDTGALHGALHDRFVSLLPSS